MLPTHTPYLCNMYIFIYFCLTVKNIYIMNIIQRCPHSHDKTLFLLQVILPSRALSAYSEFCLSCIYNSLLIILASTFHDIEEFMIYFDGVWCSFSTVSPFACGGRKCIIYCRCPARKASRKPVLQSPELPHGCQGGIFQGHVKEGSQGKWSTCAQVYDCWWWGCRVTSQGWT